MLNNNVGQNLERRQNWQLNKQVNGWEHGNLTSRPFRK